MLNVGINGFGRIGRAILRINSLKKYFNVRVINDINPSIENLAYMLKYDSTYGRFKGDIQIKSNNLLVENEKIKIFNYSKINDVPWRDYDIDILIDSSGIYNNLLFQNKLKEQDIKNLIVTNVPQNKIDKFIIMGVNEHEIIANQHFSISASICDANAIGPTLFEISKKYKIECGFVTTLHPWLGYQNLLDGPSRSFAYPGTIYKNFALGRASDNALIPKTTSAMEATCKVINNLENRFESISYRVPTSIVSSADLTVKLEEKIVKKDIVDLFNLAESKQEYDIFYNNFEPTVSNDYIKSSYSSIIDHRWTKTFKKKYLKILLWYDNEWGYSSRVVDLVKYILNKYE